MMPHAAAAAIPPRLCLATNNAHKLDEMRAIFAALLPGARLIALDEAGGPHPDAPEDGATFADNALAKARWYAARTGLPTLADDSGLCVAGLGGAPGVRSARYAPTPAARIARLLRELVEAEAEAVTLSEGTGAATAAALAAAAGEGIAAADRAAVASPLRAAHFACVMALVDPAAPGGAAAADPLLAEGRVDGVILHAPRGEGGFGYDPVFFVPAAGRTLAELPAAEKNAISHRARAAAAMAALLAPRLSR